MKSFVTGWMSHSHISYGIIRVGLGTHIGRGTLNPSIGTPIPSITSDIYGRRTKKIEGKAPLLSRIYLYHIYNERDSSKEKKETLDHI